MEYKKYHGQVLRQIRKIRNLSAEAIEAKFGISAQCIYGYEQGKCLPKKNNLTTLCSALRIDPEIMSAVVKDAFGDVEGQAKTSVNLATGEVITQSALADNTPDPYTVAVQVIQTKKETCKQLPETPRKQSNAQQEAEIVSDLAGKWLPVISEAAAAECNPGLMPLLDCVNQYSEEQAFFSEGKENDFAIRVMGESMMPWYPPGTLLLVRPYQEIPNGKRVVAVLDEGEIIFKILAKTADNKIALMSINENGKDYVFPPSGKGLRYICRVIQSIRNEDDLDDAMRQSGIHHSWETKLKNL